jgi:activating signal cointegrator 1
MNDTLKGVGLRPWLLTAAPPGLKTIRKEKRVRAISVLQPWASLLIRGVIRLLTRPAQTPYRGVLAIHAGSRFPPAARALCHQEPHKTLLRRANHHGWSLLPCGVVLGTAELVSCTRVEEFAGDADTVPDLGDYQPGRWVWEFANPVQFASPIPAAGRLGVFQISDRLLSPEVVTQ